MALESARSRRQRSRAHRRSVVVLGLCALVAVLMHPAQLRPAWAASPSQGPAATVQATVLAAQEQLHAAHVPAAAVSAVQHGQGATGAVGEGIDADTPFVLGSTSKSFTALAVLQLQDAGKVDLDAPVGTYLPQFAAADNGAGALAGQAAITVRQLLTQTSGLPTSAGLALIDHPDTSLAERAKQAARAPLASPPGEEFHYSNANYAVLGRLVEVASGQTYGQYIQDAVFDPLGMSGSYTTLTAARQHGLPPAHTVWFGASLPRSTPAYPGGAPDGFLVSTAADMATYLRFQLGDGTWQGQRILSAASMQLMHTPAAVTEPGTAAAGTDSYAMGWGVGTIKGQRLLAHDGDVIGYHAEMALLPQSASALVVLTARNGALTDARAPFAAGLAVLAGGAAPPVSEAFMRTYLVLDVVTAVVVAGSAWWLARPRWRRRVAERTARRGWLRGGAVPVVVCLLSAAGLYATAFWGLGLVTVGAPLSLRFAWGFVAPDLTVLVLLVCGVLIVRAVWTALVAYRALVGSPGTSPAGEELRVR